MAMKKGGSPQVFTKSGSEAASNKFGSKKGKKTMKGGGAMKPSKSKMPPTGY